MKENRNSEAELNSKKRKEEDEPPEMALPKKIQSNREDELEPESTSSNNFIPTSDSIMSTGETCSSDAPSTSIGISSEFSLYSSESKSSTIPETCSSSSIGISSEFSLYSSESKSSTNSSSIDGQPDCPPYKGQTRDFGKHPDFSLIEYGNNNIDQQSIDKELEVAPSNNYVLSSGRWSVNQDGQNEAKKLTIDKEFEHYFSVLML